MKFKFPFIKTEVKPTIIEDNLISLDKPMKELDDSLLIKDQLNKIYTDAFSKNYSNSSYTNKYSEEFDKKLLKEKMKQQEQYMYHESTMIPFNTYASPQPPPPNQIGIPEERVQVFHKARKHKNNIESCAACKVILKFILYEQKSLIPKPKYAPYPVEGMAGPDLYWNKKNISFPKEYSGIGKPSPIKKPVFVAKGIHFSHIVKSVIGGPYLIQEKEVNNFPVNKICNTSLPTYLKYDATNPCSSCSCGEVIIKWSY